MNLRELSGILKAPPQREFYSLASYGGIPRGAITEVVSAPGAGKTRLAARFAAENPEARVAWIEDKLTVYPPALAQAGVALERVLFVEAGAFGLWSAMQALGCGGFQVVMLSTAQEIEDVALRRLQLAAEKSQAAVLMLSERRRARGRWAIARAIDLGAARAPEAAHA